MPCDRQAAVHAHGHQLLPLQPRRLRLSLSHSGHPQWDCPPLAEVVLTTLVQCSERKLDSSLFFVNIHTIYYSTPFPISAYPFSFLQISPDTLTYLMKHSASCEALSLVSFFLTEAKFCFLINRSVVSFACFPCSICLFSIIFFHSFFFLRALHQLLHTDHRRLHHRALRGHLSPAALPHDAQIEPSGESDRPHLDYRHSEVIWHSTV